MPPTLTLTGVQRRFGDRLALADVNLRLEPGERVALAGPSGSGKSTLLRLLAGSLRASAGVVQADGVDLTTMSPRQLRDHRRSCGLVTQAAALVPQLSVHRNVLAGRLAGEPWWWSLAAMVVPVKRLETAELLARVGLADRQWDAAGTLSGGQQQRVAIARALAGRPSLILADEPTASLDPTTAREVTELLLEHTAAGKDPQGAAMAGPRSLVFCTHWLSIARAGCDRIVGLREGRVFIDQPASTVTDEQLAQLYAGSGERH